MNISLPMALVEVDFRPQQDLEFLISNEYTPVVPLKHHLIISSEEARELYFPQREETTAVYVVIGGQKGDESKGKVTHHLPDVDPRICWAAATTSTHNAGKSVHTKNQVGESVRFTFHLLPATVVDPHIRNYVTQYTQINPFILQQEILGFKQAVGRTELGDEREGYHLLVDRLASLVIPTNRLDDVVGKENLMGSTISGATASFQAVAGKIAPTWEDVLYDPDEFRRGVEMQLCGFTDRLQRDLHLTGLGIDSIRELGEALQDERLIRESKRLAVLARKLDTREIAFFTAPWPADYLLEQYCSIAESGLFFLGDTRQEISAHLKRGEAGILEGVQSVLLSGRVRYGRNRTAAGTESAQIKANAHLLSRSVEVHDLLVFKLGNTSVGGTEKTMSGFLRQDQLSRLVAKTPEGKYVSFEKPGELEAFLTPSEIRQAFEEITVAFYHALQEGHSLSSPVRVHNSSPHGPSRHLPGMMPGNLSFTLAEARALFTSYVWGEKGETSGRARIVRCDDLVESAVVHQIEPEAWQIWNALDRGTSQPALGIVTAYKVTGDYPGYQKGDIILPGMPLRQEHLTNRHCIPIIDIIPSWPTLTADATTISSPLQPGVRLHPAVSNYLSLVSRGQPVIAIGNGPGLLQYVRAVLG